MAIGLAATGTLACGSSGSPSESSMSGAGGVAGGAATSGGRTGAGAAGEDTSGGTAGVTESGGGGAMNVGGSSPVSAGSIASTGRGTCALASDGTIRCWGTSFPWRIPGGAFSALTASVDGICAIRGDGTTACFEEPSETPEPFASPPTETVKELSIQRGATCGIQASGAAFCDSEGSDPVPLAVPVGETLIHAVAGRYFACGIRAGDGSLVCWGYPGAADCLFAAPLAGQTTPPTGPFVSLSSGWLSTCAIAESGTVSCWGAGGPGSDPNALCKGEATNFGQSTPPQGTFRAVAVGVNHVCGVKTDGILACWGAGTTDECQTDGDNCRQSRPPTGKFEQVTVGNYHSCAMTAARKIQCWGYPGADATDPRLTPPAEFQ